MGLCSQLVFFAPLSFFQKKVFLICGRRPLLALSYLFVSKARKNLSSYGGPGPPRYYAFFFTFLASEATSLYSLPISSFF